MTHLSQAFLLVCLLVGVLGGVLGAWGCARGFRRQLQEQREAFELAREQARRDQQQALLCLPQWMQQTARVELEFLGRKQAERWKEQLQEQQRWQSEQDARRLAEWRALLSASPLPRREAPMPVPAPVPGPKPPAPVSSPAARPPQMPALPQIPLPPPATVHTQEAPERELTDEEIDALPPDLPAPVRPPGRKLLAPKGPVLRNI